MPCTIEFDDQRLTERLRDPYKDIDETSSVGMSFVDFISLGEELSNAKHVYFRLDDDSQDKTNHESFFYSRVKEFIDICIKDPSLYTMESFMFFLQLIGLQVPGNYQEFKLDNDNQFEDLVTFKEGKSSLEIALRGFAKSNKMKKIILSVYACENLEEICVASLYHLIKLGLAIKKCGNCGKYFVPLHRSDTVYCDRPSPFNPSRTCKEDGSQRAFEEKLKLDDVEKLRRQVYQSKQMRVRRNPDVPSYKENFEKWKTQAAKWKKDIKKGLRTSEEFVQWLNDSKQKF